RVTTSSIWSKMRLPMNKVGWSLNLLSPNLLITPSPYIEDITDDYSKYLKKKEEFQEELERLKFKDNQAELTTKQKSIQIEENITI
ncbi:32928_t:CDS:1, partial [Racocetra persica]